ncbi:MAG: hypothetical protein D6725_17705 [Planctomycetota bacterium]|nr:MAG: hypothetical protein D6725_17705 [Planctomycetota bacterium]
MVVTELAERVSTAALKESSGFAGALIRRIQDLLKTRLGNIASDLHIDFDGDAVILSGLAPSFYVKQAATHAALEAIDALADNPFALVLRNEIAVV